MPLKHLDDSWKSWLSENIERKCNPEELLGILIRNNFALSSIRASMGQYYPANSPLVAEYKEEKTSDADYKAISETRISRLDSGLKAQQLMSDKIQLYTIDHFLSDKESDQIVELMQSSLRPSTVTREHPTDKYYRTSSTCDLSLINDKTIKDLDEKIASALGIRLAYAEGTQGQHYEVGQEFKQHTDYFEPGTEEFIRFGGDRGQRTWTFMIYLNTVPEGGGTRFFKIDQTFQPQKGRAVIWNNLHPDGIPNYNTLHAGLPVLSGHKDIITKWFREKGSGPMFY